MGRKKKADALGFVALILIGIVAAAWKANPLFGVGALVLMLILFGAMFGSKRCDICKNTIERGDYRWKIDGRNVRVCAHCNQTIRRKQSRSATDNLFS